LQKILIFGNSGAGKSTLAKRISTEKNIAHLDLDTLAWQASTPPQRMPIEESKRLINAFTEQNSAWVIEGCYTDLLVLLTSTATETVKHTANEIIFLDLPVDVCIANAEKRPWESHKYPSKQAQDENLAMLIDWIKAYETRDDTFSKKAHQQFYQCFNGKKNRIIKNS